MGFNKLLGALLLAVFLAGGREAPEKIDLLISGEVFTIEVARTEEQRQRGLMFRKSLGAREGMFFIFETDQHLSFWMKNTEIPLSLAFLSSRGEILEIAEMKPFSLKTITSKRAACYALELPLGSFEEVGARVGYTVIIPEELK